MPRNIRIADIGVKILQFFLVTSTLCVLYLFWKCVITGTWHILHLPVPVLLAGAAVFIVEFVLFWIGISMVYLSSGQLGIRTRVLGAVFGWVPLINLHYLMKIISVTREEVVVG